MACPADFEKVNERLGKVLTQYRESPKLLHIIRTALRQVEIVQQSICDLPAFFDIETAVGDQLTLLGRRMGFPRQHCICNVQPVFGFECDDPLPFATPVDGFCADVNWEACADLGVSYVSIDDDDLYRAFLKARRYQIRNLTSREDLEQVIKDLWGEQAMLMGTRNGEIVIAPGRALTSLEMSFIQLYPRVLPVAIGIRVRFHFGTLNVFGFGDGWGGFCLGDSTGGAPLSTEQDEDPILTEDGQEILVDLLMDSAWMCPIDVRPYDC